MVFYLHVRIVICISVLTYCHSSLACVCSHNAVVPFAYGLTLHDTHACTHVYITGRATEFVNASNHV